MIDRGTISEDPSYLCLQSTLYWQTDLIGFFSQSMSSQPAFSRFPLSSATNFIFTQF